MNDITKPALASSPYLELPSRSEAEVTIERIESLRAKVTAIQAFAREQLAGLGVDKAELDYMAFVDIFNDAVCGVERTAKDAIEEAECREEFEHTESERRALAWKI